MASYKKLIAKTLPKTKKVAPPGMGAPAMDEGFHPGFVPRPDPVALNYGDPQYIGANAQGQLPFQQGLARLPGDVGSLASQYGYTFNYDPGAAPPTPGPGDDPNDPKFLAPDPTVTITGVDTSNPYSRAALLQRSYDQTKAGNTTGYAARGQLYSGALGNAQNAATQGFNTSSDQLRGSFNEVIHGWLGNLGSSRLGAGAAKTTALGDLTQRQAADPAPQTFGGVGYERDKFGNLTPIGKPTAASVLASGSLAGTGAAGSGVYRPLKKRKK